MAPLYRHPETGKEKTASQWAAELGIERRAFTKRFLRHKGGIQAFNPKNNAKLYTNPATGESRTAGEWDAYLGLDKGGFLSRYRYNGQCARIYDAVMGPAANVNCYTNPFTGERKTQPEWAKELGIAIPTLRQRVQEWGLENPKTWHKGPICGRPGKPVLHVPTNRKFSSINKAAKAFNYTHNGLRPHIDGKNFRFLSRNAA